MRLHGKVALVTGASPNIGGGIIEALAAEGATIVAVDANPVYAQDCAAYVRGQGGLALGLTCDVASEVEVEAATATALAAFGRIDILINNAAFFHRKGVIDMAYADWRLQIDVILGGAFLFTRAVARSMIARGEGGVMINIASTAAHQGEPNNIAYGTAKAGILNFTRSVAMEMAPHGIRVNSLTPTATDPDEQADRAGRWGRTVELSAEIDVIMRPFRDAIPQQKLPKPSDYGKAAVFLASDDAERITGIDLRVDGGAIAKYWAWSPKA